MISITALIPTVFVVHGGLGPATCEMTLSQIDMLDRFKEPEFDDEIVETTSLSSTGESSTIAVREFCPGGMSELLWSGKQACP